MVRALAVLVVSSGVAAAAPARLQLDGEDCDLTAVEARVAQLEGTDPFAPSATAVVRIDARKQADHFVASVVFDDGNGHVRGPRVVDATTCPELTESLALIIAMALPEPVELAPADVVVSRPEPARDEPRTTDALEVAIHVAPPSTDAPSTTALFVDSAEGTSGHGLERRLIIGARRQRGSASLGVELNVLLPEQQQVGAVGEITVWSSEVTASPCLHRGSLAGCAIVSAGFVEGSGTGLMSARRAFTPLLAGGIRLAWEPVIAGRVSLLLHVDLEGYATSTRFDVDHMAVWTNDRIAAWGGAGLIVHFP